MCEPSVEEVVTYLSVKFNKIFYEREFVCCVSSDFHKLKSKNNKCCVLVFPALGPLYRRAVKYQAKAFDLASFGLSGATFKTIAVCQKKHLLLNENKQEIEEEKEKMTSEASKTPSEVRDVNNRKKRPERELYVPPAQRKLINNKDANTESRSSICKSSIPSSSSERAIHKPGPSNVRPKRTGVEIMEKGQSSKVSQCEKSVQSGVESDTNVVNINEFAESILTLHDLMHLNFLQLPNFSSNLSHKIDNKTLSLKNFHESCCEFHQYLISKCENSLKFCIPIFRLSDTNFLHLLIDNYFCWQPISTDNLINFDEIIENNCAIPFFNYIKNADDSDFIKSDLTNSFTLNQVKLCTKIKIYEGERAGIMQVNVVGDASEAETIFEEDFVIGNLLRIVCDTEPFENIVDLTKLRMGHYFKIPNGDGSEYFHVCEDIHDIQKCYMDVKKKLLSHENVSRTNQGTSNLEEKEHKSEHTEPSVPKTINKTEVIEVVKRPEREIYKPPHRVVTKPEVKISKDIKDTKKLCQHEEEKEIMRKAKENMNRKTRPIMKYSDDSDDFLKIDKQDNVNNWEDLFDDDGQIQEELLTEIVHKVGKDMTIVKASEDYTPYMVKPALEELDHVVEIYNFPPSLSTGDIMHTFSMFDSDSMYIVWVDDTHALLVLGSSSQAQRAMEVKNPLIKVRPVSNASAVSMEMASQYDLRPAMKRPPTNLQTARRLITNHLGTKSQVTKEQTAKERELLRQAREQRNKTKQNERDAWEGNVHSNKKP